MSYIEAIGYVATALNVAGNLMLTRLNVWGWVVRLLVNFLYIAYAVQIDGGAPMWVNHLIFVAINIEGWRKWQRLQKTRQCIHPIPKRVSDDVDLFECTGCGARAIAAGEPPYLVWDGPK